MQPYVILFGNDDIPLFTMRINCVLTAKREVVYRIGRQPASIGLANWQRWKLANR